jgi:hypothetical protein
MYRKGFGNDAKNVNKRYLEGKKRSGNGCRPRKFSCEKDKAYKTKVNTTITSPSLIL